MIRRPLAWVALVAALGFACVGADRPLAPRLEDVDGGFEYRAYDGDGELLLVGTVTLETDADSSIAGTWEIRWAPGADTTTVVGPQVGSGTLAGWLRAEYAAIDLNPGWADNNVFLVARAEDHGALRGEWHYSTFIGPVAEGRFELRSP
jgi:hypothetical protein